MSDFRTLIREAGALGARLRILGSEVEIENLASLPGVLQHSLVEYNGYMYAWLGGTDADNEAIEFLAKLGVEAVLVTDRDGAEAPLRELTGAEFIGLDIETAPCPQYEKPREPVAINADGSVSAVQPIFRDKTGLDPYRSDIACVQLYGGGKRCFVFRGDALRQLIDNRWIREQHLVAHNAVFELAFLRHHSKPTAIPAKAYPVECTMQASGLLHGVHQRSLANASIAQFGIEPPKLLQTSYWAAPKLSDGQVAYAASDAVLAWRMWREQQVELNHLGRWNAYVLQRDALPAVADMELRGLGFDRDEHARQVDEWSRELASARHHYLELTGKPAPSKPAEIRAWLSDIADTQNWPRTPTGELSTRSKHLKRLVLSDVPTVRPVLSMLAMEKLLSTFGPKLADFINPATGRIHCHYNVAASKAGRFTASDPNLQQLPSTRAPDFRRAIVAGPGNVLVGADWNQLELRAAAWLSEDQALTAVYREGRDLHRETAAAVAGVRPEDVTPTQRAAAKAVNFGSLYGIGARSLAENAFSEYGIEMTVDQAQTALDRFFERFHGLRTWRRRHSDVCQAHGYVEIEGGRIVKGEWEFGGTLSFPQCCNLPVQGIAANAMLLAIKLAYRRLRNIRGGLVASVHDELLAEVAEDDADQAKAILEETMTEAFAVTFPDAPLAGVVISGIGKNWKEVK